MTDTMTLTSPTETLASPLQYKLKAMTPTGFPLYGCEHLEKLLTRDNQTSTQCIRQYVHLLKILHQERPRKAQTWTSRGPKAASISFTGVTPAYHCLQCPRVSSAKERDTHGMAEKHFFAVESRSGCIYCVQCQDLIYDQSFEELRIRRDPETAFPGRKKRKLHELYPAPEDARYVYANAGKAPCRPGGLRGLYNMGQTCFMSVILQSLIHNPFLRNFYLGDGHKSMDCGRENCLSCAVDETFSEFFSAEKTDGYGAVNVMNRSWLRNPAWAGCRQQDAHEYFQYLVDQLHGESVDDSVEVNARAGHCSCIIHRTYYGKLQSDVTCSNCKFTSTTSDPMIDLSLDLRNPSVDKRGNKSKGSPDRPKAGGRLDLYDCLDNYIRSERTTYNCDRCNGSQQSAMKQLSIRNLPPVLAIQFKRFEAGFDAPSAIASKLNTVVAFPLQLDMSPYTTRALRPKSGNAIELTRSCTYELTSVVVHIGQINGGHYVAYCREGRQWYLFDDHKVSAASEKQVLEAEAYLLMYTVRSIT